MSCMLVVHVSASTLEASSNLSGRQPLHVACFVFTSGVFAMLQGPAVAASSICGAKPGEYTAALEPSISWQLLG